MDSYIYKALGRTNDRVDALCQALYKQRGKITRSRLVVAALVIKVALMSREIDELRQRLEGAGV